MDLVVEVYKQTDSFPRTEVFGLSSQMRRCAVSIPANLAEGSGRQTQRELLRFVRIALGSAAELETHCIIATRLGYTVEPSNLLLDIREVKALILGLESAMKRRLDRTTT